MVAGLRCSSVQIAEATTTISVSAKLSEATSVFSGSAICQTYTAAT